ncbi:MAG: hypothetical protein AAFX97_10635, partial [Pseudomonadota bacterium]
EQKWWDGPASCTGGGMGDLSGADLLNLDSVRVIMCDEISWQLLGSTHFTELIFCTVCYKQHMFLKLVR